MNLKEKETQQNEQKQSVLLENKNLTSKLEEMKKTIDGLQALAEDDKDRYESLWNRCRSLEEENIKIKEKYKKLQKVTAVIIGVLLMLFVLYVFS